MSKFDHVDKDEATEELERSSLKQEFPARRMGVCLCCGKVAKIRPMMHVCEGCHQWDGKDETRAAFREIKVGDKYLRDGNQVEIIDKTDSTVTCRATYSACPNWPHEYTVSLAEFSKLEAKTLELGGVFVPASE